MPPSFTAHSAGCSDTRLCNMCLYEEDQRTEIRDLKQLTGHTIASQAKGLKSERKTTNRSKIKEKVIYSRAPGLVPSYWS